MEPAATKRPKRDPADDLICPLTHELPIDPVTAEDGKVYERAAILQHFESSEKRGLELQSPLTRQAMGRNLVPSTQIRSLIETLVENEVITGSLAETWKVKEEEKKKFEALLEDAEGGDIVAMFDVGHCYNKGKLGVVKDLKKAYSWYKRAADAGNIPGMAYVGFALVLGCGVDRNPIHGMSLVSLAAGRGSDLACILLGLWYASGYSGLPVDTSQAKYWLRCGTDGSCTVNHATDSDLADARLKLQELEN